MFWIGICDDDAEFCIQLETLAARYIRQEQMLAGTKVFYSGDVLLQYLEGKHPLDILFLDIEMAGRNGLQVAQWIRSRAEGEKTQIVFVSARENYAMQLFKTRPFDFLTKPVRWEDVCRVMAEYKRLFIDRNIFFTFHMGKNIYSISENEIEYFKCEGKKVQAVTLSGTKEFYGKMSEVQKKISAHKFCTIHKSYIVNMNYVKEFMPDGVLVNNGEKLPISQSHRKKVREKVLQWNMQSGFGDRRK